MDVRSARLEGGYRYGGPAFGVTPYAAAQMQSVRTPDYNERATAGSNAKHYAISASRTAFRSAWCTGGKVDAVAGFGWRTSSDRPR